MWSSHDKNSDLGSKVKMQNNNMTTNISIQCRIGRLADKQGSRLQGQLEAEKSITETNSFSDDQIAPQNRNSNPGPSELSSNTCQSEKRLRWSREEYKDVVKAYFMALKTPTKKMLAQTYDIWRNKVGNDTHPNVNANTLGNLRRYILKNNRLTTAEIEEIKKRYRARP